MSNRVIPKDELINYKRWEMGSFDAAKKTNKPTAVVETTQLPTAAELESIHQRAQQEGYETGLQIAQNEATQLKAIVQSFSQSLNDLEKEVADKVLTLSLLLAKQIIRESLNAKPELILPIIKEALQSLVESKQHNLLRLNPNDLEVVNTHMGDELDMDGWKIVGDDRIEAGGCKVESASGEVNATLENRWKRVIANLGRNDEWLD